jgi:hypothetical protein
VGLGRWVNTIARGWGAWKGQDQERRPPRAFRTGAWAKASGREQPAYVARDPAQRCNSWHGLPQAAAGFGRAPPAVILAEKHTASAAAWCLMRLPCGARYARAPGRQDTGAPR